MPAPMPLLTPVTMARYWERSILSVIWILLIYRQSLLPARAKQRKIVVWVVGVFGDLIIIQICAPAYTVLFKFNVTVFHPNRVRQNNAAPIIIEIIKDFVNKEVRRGSVE